MQRIPGRPSKGEALIKSDDGTVTDVLHSWAEVDGADMQHIVAFVAPSPLAGYSPADLVFESDAPSSEINIVYLCTSTSDPDMHAPQTDQYVITTCREADEVLVLADDDWTPTQLARWRTLQSVLEAFGVVSTEIE